MENLSSRLQQLRLSRGCSKTALAKAVGVSRRTVYAWEVDSKEPTISNIIPLAKFYRISADELLGLTDDLHN